MRTVSAILTGFCFPVFEQPCVAFADLAPGAGSLAPTLMPDAIIFGFTLANIALMCSESLQIPIIGVSPSPTNPHHWGGRVRFGR